MTDDDVASQGKRNGRPGPRRVLIVDDEPLIVATLRFHLEQAGFDCLEADDGLKAIKAAREGAPDLVLLDVMLPKINGFKVCRLLKADSAFKGVPVVMLTARGQERDRANGREAGADAYVVKPFDPGELIGLIGRLLERGAGEG